MKTEKALGDERGRKSKIGKRAGVRKGRLG
jgi:hypothetical protein